LLATVVAETAEDKSLYSVAHGMMSPMSGSEIERYLREREALKREMHTRLEGLRAKATEGEMTPQALRSELEAIMQTYLGGAAGDVRPALDELMTTYDELFKSVGQREAVTQLLRALDVEGPPA
jgi:hypothetical protein